jgi:hypothetical protein
MAPKTPRLRLNNPGVNDPFSVTDLSENWSLLDAHPGVYICTSSTRPTWGEDQDGQLIYETDSSLYWYWKWSGVSGSFIRFAPVGLLGRTVYTSANVTNNATASPTTITSVTVTPKAGGRSVRIDAGWYAISSNTVAGIVGLYRGTTLLASYRCQPGAGGALTFYEVPPSTSSTTYSIRLVTSANATNSTLIVSATLPAFISVAEV